jgi:hypothetical protein
MNLKRTYNTIIKKTGIEDREYAKDFLTNEIYQKPKLPIVLGAGTSSGKTVMAIIKLIMFYLNTKNKNKQTLVIPAFQEILRDNFVEQLKEIRIMYGVLPFTYKIIKGRDSKQQIKEAMDNGVNVIICLPTTINNNSNLFKNKIEWLYVDEAQYYYLAKMCKDMVKAIKPKYQLLMTGSVAKYNADSNNYIMKYVPVSELHRLGLISNPRIELVQSSYDLKDTDYKSMFGSLKEGKTNSIAKNIQSLHSVAKEMVLTLKNRFPNLVTNKYYGKRAIRIFGDIDKTIMICHSIPQANCFYKILFKELKGKVLISHSERPKDEMNMFNQFKTDDSKLLIVVNQGRIGYSMKELFNIVDFSMSKDFEIIQQIVGRLLRVSDLQPNKQKIYYKVSTTDLAKWYEYVMRCVMCLMRLEWYSTYKGDKKQFKFPYMVRNQNQSTNKTKSNSKSKSNNRFKISDEFPLDLDYVNYVEQNMKSEFATYAWWTLEDVLKQEFGKLKSYNFDEALSIAKSCKDKNEFLTKYKNYAKGLAHHNQLDTVYNELGWVKNKRRTLSEVKEAISKCSSMEELNTKYSWARYWATRYGYHNLFEHLKSFKTLNKENVYKIFKDWKGTKKDFREKYSPETHWAERNGYYDKWSSHFKSGRWQGKYTQPISFYKKLIKENNINSSYQLKSYDSGMYAGLNRNGILKKLFVKK